MKKRIASSGLIPWEKVAQILQMTKGNRKFLRKNSYGLQSYKAKQPS
jgi:chromosome segregation ATPase